jgi:hypothetical protein
MATDLSMLSERQTIYAHFCAHVMYVLITCLAKQVAVCVSSQKRVSPGSDCVPDASQLQVLEGLGICIKLMFHSQFGRYCLALKPG